MEYRSCILFLFRIGCVFPTTAMLCRRAHRAATTAPGHGALSTSRVFLLQLVNALFKVLFISNAWLLVEQGRHWNQKWRPPEEWFSYTIFRKPCKIISIVLKSAQRNALISLWRCCFHLSGVCQTVAANNRLCYGSIFYSLFAFEQNLPRSYKKCKPLIISVIKWIGCWEYLIQKIFLFYFVFFHLKKHVYRKSVGGELWNGKIKRWSNAS